MRPMRRAAGALSVRATASTSATLALATRDNCLPRARRSSGRGRGGAIIERPIDHVSLTDNNSIVCSPRRGGGP